VVSLDPHDRPAVGPIGRSVSRVGLLSVPQKVGWTSTVRSCPTPRTTPGTGARSRRGRCRAGQGRAVPLEHVEVRVTAARVQRECRPGSRARSGLEHLGLGRRHRGHRPPAVRFGFGVVWGGAAQPVAGTRPSRAMSTATRLRAAEYSSSVSAPGRCSGQTPMSQRDQQRQHHSHGAGDLPPEERQRPEISERVRLLGRLAVVPDEHQSQSLLLLRSYTVERPVLDRTWWRNTSETGLDLDIASGLVHFLYEGISRSAVWQTANHTRPRTATACAQ
jgi:hypothetical protein